jgi:predicted acylesterase/phospholipase RssA
MEFINNINLTVTRDGKLVENKVETPIVETPIVENKVETPIVENKVETLLIKTEYIPELFDYDTLVLSGGSTKGIVTLGCLQSAQDSFLLTNIKTYIGTSSGAIICYLMVIGYTPIEIVVYICTHQLLEKMQHFNVVAMLNGSGASSFNHIQEHIEKMTISKIGYLPTLKDIQTKFGKTLICVTHNLTTNTTEYLDPEHYPNLPCITAIRMSSNLPLIFEHFKYGDNFYIDGGISDNFAIDLGDKIGDKVLGILLSPENDNFTNKIDSNILELIYKLIFIPIKQAISHKLKNCSDKCKIIELDYKKLKFFDFNVSSIEKLEMFSSGYQQFKDLEERV